MNLDLRRLTTVVNPDLLQPSTEPISMTIIALIGLVEVIWVINYSKQLPVGFRSQVQLT